MLKNKVPRTLAVLALPKPVPALITLARHIVTMMSGNASFPQPEPPLSTVTSSINDLDTAETAAVARAKGAVATRNEKRAVVVSQLELLRGSVQKVVDANPENGPSLIQSAGMSIRKPVNHKPRTFSAKLGAVSGTVKVEVPSAARRASYDWEFSADGGKTWQLAPSSLQTKTTFTGLQPMTTVWFRYRAVIKTGPADWSPAISILVL